jgi:hypothetical protein
MADTSFTSKGLNTALTALIAPTNLIASVAAGVSGVSGTYSYIVTAFNGGESIASSGITYANTAHTGVSVAFTAVAGATDYRLYRSGVGATGYLLVANSASGQSPLRDTFSSTISGYQGFYVGADTSAKESRAIGSRATAFYTVSAGRTLLKEAVLSNGHDAAVTFDFHVVPSGNSVSHGNKLFSAVSLDAAETKILSLNTVLEEGDSIQAKASEIGYIPGYGCVSLKISGIEISDS